MYRAANVTNIRITVLSVIRQILCSDESIYIRNAKNKFNDLSLMNSSIAENVPDYEVLLCLCDEILSQLDSTGIILTYNCMYIKASNASWRVFFGKIKRIYADGHSLFVNDYEFKFSPKMKFLKELESIIKNVIAQCDFSCCLQLAERNAPQKNEHNVRDKVFLIIRQLPCLAEPIFIRDTKDNLGLDRLNQMRDSIAKNVSIDEFLLCLCDEILPQLSSTGIILTYNCMYIKAPNGSLQMSFDKIKRIFAAEHTLVVNDYELKFSSKMKLLKELEETVRDVITQCDFSCSSSHIEKFESANAMAEKDESEKNGCEQSVLQRNEMISENVTCNSCGAKIAVGSKFCPECGAKQNFQTVCPSCGFQNGSVFKFCPECGTKQESEKSPETTAHLQNPENHASSLDVQNNRWDESEAYAVLEKDFDNLLSKIVKINDYGEPMVGLVRPLMTSKVFPHLMVAHTAKETGDINAFYNAFLMNLCDFSMSAEEYKKELIEQLFVATPFALLIINDIINLVARKTEMDLSDICLNENGLDEWYLSNLNTALEKITAEIRKQASFYPQLKASMNAVKAKAGKYNSQNFIQRNKDAFISAGVNFARGFLGDSTVIAEGIKEFFNDGTDPDFRMFQQTAEQIMDMSDSGNEAVFGFALAFEDLYIDILTNGVFKNWLMDACKKMVDMGIQVSVISECIQEKTANMSWYDEKFHSLDIYTDYLCSALVVKDAVARQPLWNLGCAMLDCFVNAEIYMYYPDRVDITSDDISEYFEKVKTASQVLGNPLNEYMAKIVIDNLSHIQSNDGVSPIYVISDGESNNDEFEFFEEKLYAARDKYAPDLMISEILAYYDDTLFGKGDDGFILSKNAIYIKEFGANVQIIPFEDINRIFWSESKNWLGTSRYLQINGVDYSCGLDEDVLNAFVLGLREIVAEYQKI